MNYTTLPENRTENAHENAENIQALAPKRTSKTSSFLFGALAGSIIVAGLGYYGAAHHITVPQQNLQLDAKDLRTQILAAQKIITSQNQSIAQMQSQLAQVLQKLEQIEATQIAVNADVNLRIQDLEKNAGASNTAIPMQQESHNAKSVLILALEVAANNGQPFQSQLARFRGGFPKLDIPPSLQDASNSGILPIEAMVNEIQAQNSAIFKKMTVKTTVKIDDKLITTASDLSLQDSIMQKLGNWVKISKTNTPKSEVSRIILGLEADIKVKNWQNADKIWQNLPDDVKALLPKTKAGLAVYNALSAVLARSWIEIEGQK